jgi:hypothetical protein
MPLPERNPRVSSAHDIEHGPHEPQEPGPVEVLPRQTARDIAARVITEVLAPPMG